MKDYLVISTGGTIASSRGDNGLKPTITGEDLIRQVPQLEGRAHRIGIEDLMSKDSSNMVPSDWAEIARVVRQNEQVFHSVIILHGTDTMAYTASALSFLLCDFPKPVILTGSMKTITEFDTDAVDNIVSTFRFADHLISRKQAGVSISFADKLIHGPRSEKIVSREKTAFESINYPLIGCDLNGDVSINHRPLLSGKSTFRDADYLLEKNIVLLKIYPGFQASFLEHVLDMSPRAVVLESLGLGGVPYIGENLLPALAMAREKGIPVVITTQCVYGGVDLTVYEVGRKTLDLGVISGRDMTKEAIITKLMVILPHVSSDNVGTSLHECICDEVAPLE